MQNGSMMLALMPDSQQDGERGSLKAARAAPNEAITPVVESWGCCHGL